jgi:hypothetical protein
MFMYARFVPFPLIHYALHHKHESQGDKYKKKTFTQINENIV